jgi:hypothetical protein
MRLVDAILQVGDDRRQAWTLGGVDPQHRAANAGLAAEFLRWQTGRPSVHAEKGLHDHSVSRFADDGGTDQVVGGLAVEDRGRRFVHEIDLFARRQSVALNRALPFDEA